MNLEFAELHAFVVLAGELHFRKAAERLFLSQPALSKKIQRLEEKLKGTCVWRIDTAALNDRTRQMRFA
jgi:Bacterial regulatory helix-turn-helix protein, lysR family